MSKQTKCPRCKSSHLLISDNGEYYKCGECNYPQRALVVGDHVIGTGAYYIDGCKGVVRKVKGDRVQVMFYDYPNSETRQAVTMWRPMNKCILID
jgi:hypothetical protein